MKFQIIENDKIQHSASNRYAWRLLADDGRVLARSRRYKSLDECKHDVRYVALGAVSVSLDYLLADGSFDFDNLASTGIVPDDASDDPFATPLFTDPHSPLNDPLDPPLYSTSATTA